jgi:hypothetical protein
MSNEIHELSSGDLDEVSGGWRNSLSGTSITPSIPIPPPEAPGPVIPGHGPIVFNTPGPFYP